MAVRAFDGGGRGRKRDRARSPSEDSSDDFSPDDLVTWEDAHGSSQEDSDGSEYHGGGDGEYDN